MPDRVDTKRLRELLMSAVPGDDAIARVLAGVYLPALLDAYDRLAAASTLAARQAEDEGLWFVARTCPEAYLQQELRALHRAIEGEREEPGE